MRYEVREVKRGRKLIGFGIFLGGEKEPIQIYKPDGDTNEDLSIAHYLALTACRDFEEGTE